MTWRRNYKRPDSPNPILLSSEASAWAQTHEAKSAYQA